MRVYLIDQSRVDRKKFIKELAYALYMYIDKNKNYKHIKIQDWIDDALSNESPQISTVIDQKIFTTFVNNELKEIKMKSDYKTPICNLIMKKDEIFELVEEKGTGYLVMIPELMFRVCIPKHIAEVIE